MSQLHFGFGHSASISHFDWETDQLMKRLTILRTMDGMWGGYPNQYEPVKCLLKEEIKGQGILLGEIIWA